MNNKIRSTISGSILLFIILCAITACQPVYVPNVVNMPMLKEANEVQLSVHSAAANFDVQGAYAINEKYAVMLNGSFQNRKFSDDLGFRKSNFGELGFGRRKELGTSGIFEFFGGLGYGNINARYPVNEFYWKQQLDVQFGRAFLQPSIAFVSDFVDFGIAPRLVYVNIIENNTNYDGLFIEPAASLKFGYKYVKAIAQIGFSIPLNDRDFDYNPFLISIGLQFSLNTAKLKKQ